MISAEEQQTITVVHALVPGRTRLRVPGLRGSKRLKNYLESALREGKSVITVCASTSTGNILIYHDRHTPLPVVMEIIERVFQGYGDRKFATTSTPTSNWHLMEVAQVLRRLRSSMQGLSPDVFQSRLTRLGPNVLPGIRPRSKTEIFLDQFQSLPVALLIIAAILSVATGGVADGVIVLCVVALNAGIGYVTESHAERTIVSLSITNGQPVPVIRGGTRELIPIEEAVLGDLLELRPGVVVAADARVVDAQRLTLDEAMLTGESIPVPKTVQRLEGIVPLAERSNMVFRGTIVTGGGGCAIVVATGGQTEIGSIQALVGAANAPETPLQQQLKSLGRQLVLVAGGACGLAFFTGLLRGYGILEMLKSSIALAVAAVPEGLPTLATTTLALGIERMRHHNVLVRRLDSIETLAAVEAICLDKTGTLTLNKMTVTEIDCDGHVYHAIDGRLLDQNNRPVTFVTAPALKRLAKIVALCNETVIAQNTNGSELQGSSTERALIELALGLGLDVVELRSRYPLVNVIYRSEQQLFMITLHAARANRCLAAIKGSPKDVLALCCCTQEGDERVSLTEEKRRLIEQSNLRMTTDGQRVLGVAYAIVRDHKFPQDRIPADLTWLGLVGMADPLREGIGELFKALRAADISPIMITGDQKGTAAAVARKLDMENGGQLRIIDSGELQSLGRTPELSQIPHVFARVTPAQKLHIVRTLQHAGLTIAMTGDGINDSPALKAADIGIAMGHSGSEAAREAAHVVLQDDNLMSLVPAIELGRTTCINIQKAIRFILATNFSEILVTIAASAAGLGQPLTPRQLLWINLISDIFPALALGLEPPEPNIMETSPRDRDQRFLGPGDFRHLAREAALISTGALGAYGFGLSKYGPTNQARTICLASLVTAQLLHSLSCRSDRNLFFKASMRPNHLLSIVLGCSFALQSAAMVLGPFRRLLGISAIGYTDALVALATGVAPFIANEQLKNIAPHGAKSS